MIYRTLFAYGFVLVMVPGLFVFVGTPEQPLYADSDLDDAIFGEGGGSGSGPPPPPITGSGDSSFSLTNPLGDLTLTGFLAKLLDIAILIGTPIVVLFVVYSGFLFVTAQGNQQKLTDAKRALLYTLLGAVVLLGAFAISTAIQGTIGAIK